MSIHVFFDPSKLDEAARVAISDPDRSHLTITIGGRPVLVEARDGEVSTKIERERQLNPEAWAAVGHVSIRDTVTDSKMVAQMASGEYDVEGGSATVQIWEKAQTGYGMIAADIEIIAPTWAAATTLHRDILFGKLPDRPYVRTVLSVDES